MTNQHQTLLDPFLAHTEGALRNRAYLRYKPTHGEPYRDMTFAEFGAKVREASAGFASLGINRGDRIAIVSESRPEWLISEFATLALGAIWVPMFPTLMPPEIEFIVNDCGAKMLIVSNEFQFAKARKIAESCPTMEVIVMFNSDTHAVLSCKKVFHFADLINPSDTSRQFRCGGSKSFPERYHHHHIHQWHDREPERGDALAPEYHD